MSSLYGIIFPPGYSVEANATEATNYAQEHRLVDNYWWFYEHVRNGGIWDYKQDNKKDNKNYADAGNFNYGVTGTAMGIPEQILLRMAGVAQMIAGTSMPEYGLPWAFPPYGDDPRDQQRIQEGIRWAKENNYDGTGAWWGTASRILQLEILCNGTLDPNKRGLGDIFDDYFNAAQDFLIQPVRDPLALDLDGDGLETTRFSPNSPVWFDHDVNGAAEGSGWLGSDDGFLVLDRNGNGLIDNGSELFGDHTPLNGGGDATNGFAALAQEDTNGDGQTGDIDFSVDTFHSHFTETLPVPDEVAALPQLGGSGLVRSLREAATQSERILFCG